MSFGDLLRQYRREAGLTQDALAERAGISKRAVQHLEGRFGQPFPDTARRLAQALALPPEQAAELLAAVAPTPRRRGARPEPGGAPSSTAPAAPTGDAGGSGSVWAPSAGLPVQLTSFVGRDRDLATARAVLARPNVRLLTLTGAPGTGKTRLALRLAEDVADRYPDGAIFVSLAALTDPSLVAGTVGQVLGVREAGTRQHLDAIAAVLRDRTLLLVLDNFEQVVVAAPWVAELLAAAPGLTALVTSRAVLRVRGEHELAIPPLGLPDPVQVATVQSLATSPAVTLFVERAQAVRADFALTASNAATIAEICHRLDGLPLAIELAAARIRLFSPDAMLTRLERRLPLLTDGPSDLPDRQRTLRDTIAWSYDLLDEDERVLFRRLAVFVGGCTFEAIEAVCDAGDTTLDLVAALLSRSLLQQVNAAGEPRLSVLETIREFGLEQLAASGELDVVRRRHAAFFLALAEEADPRLRGPEQVGVLDLLEAEHANLRAALAWSQSIVAAGPNESDDAQLGLRLVSALFGYWYLRGHVREGRDWMARLLPSSQTTAEFGAPVRTVAGARAHFAAGWLALFQGDYVVARAHYEASVAIWRALGDRQGLGRALVHLGIITQIQDDLATAVSVYDESVRLLREVGDLRWLALPLVQLGIVAQQQGDRDGARSRFEEAEALARAAGDRAVLAQALRMYGIWHARGGDLARAEQHYREALRTVRDLGDRWFMPRCLLAVAELAVDRQAYERAARLLGAADAALGTIGGQLYPYEREERDRYLMHARTAIGACAVDAAWADGQELTPEAAVAFALGEDCPPA